MYCRTCDIEYPNTLRFCKYCGEGLVARESVGTQYCPACGSTVEREWAFCNECGVDLATLGAQPKDEICLSCSATVKRGWMFCRQCGEQAASDRAPHRCPNCNAGVRDGWVYCKQCGVGVSAHGDGRAAFRTVAGIPALPPEEDEAEPFSNLKSGELPPLDDVISGSRKRQHERAAAHEDVHQGTKPLTVTRTTGHLDTDALEQEFRNHSASDAAHAVAREGRLEASELFDSGSDLPTNALAGEAARPSAQDPSQTQFYVPAPPAGGSAQPGTMQVDQIPPVGASLNGPAQVPPAAPQDSTLVMSAPLPPPPHYDPGGATIEQDVVVPPAFQPPSHEGTQVYDVSAANATQVYDVQAQAGGAQLTEVIQPPTEFDPYATHVAPVGSFGVQPQSTAPSFAPPATPPPRYVPDSTPGNASPTLALPVDPGTSSYAATGQAPPTSPWSELHAAAGVAGHSAGYPAADGSAAYPPAQVASDPFPSPQHAGPKSSSASGMKFVILGVAGLVLFAIVGVAGFFGVRWWQNRQVAVAPPPVGSEPSPPTSTEPPPPVSTLPEGMVLIPGGVTSVGTDAESGDEFSKPAHSVTVKPFLIDTTEVTNSKYKEFVDATGRAAPRDWVNGAPKPGTEEWPVVFVSWGDATEYATWAKKRLPTELEWEFAARGLDGRTYPWGSTWDATKGNLGKSKGGSIEKVGKYPAGASPFGVLDMVGNVWEWTSSSFSIYPGSTVDPAEAKSFDGLKVIRGGAYDNVGGNTAMYRGFFAADEVLPKVGFRCAKDAP